MKVKFIQSPSAAPYLLAYFIGDEAVLEDALAKDLIFQKIAVSVDSVADSSEKAISKQAKQAEKR